MEFDRRRFYKLWLLFVVFATGLVWVWSMVGQRSEQAGEIVGGPVDLLRVESGCDLALAPCAAYGDAIGLVASAKAEGKGVLWRVKLVGDQAPALPGVKLSLLPVEGKETPLDVVQVADEWQAHTAARVLPGTTLRVRVEGGAVPLVADFPLHGAR